MLNFMNNSKLSRLLGNMGLSFYLLVVFPVAASAIYFFALASDVYISQSAFVVRSSDSPKVNGLGLIFSSAMSSSNDENAYAAEAFITSRDALAFLNQNDAIAKAYGHSSISLLDRFNPIGFGGQFEDLYRYFENKIKVEHDRSTSITEIKVRAFTPAEAQKINRQLVEQAENVVNKLNERARADTIGSAKREADAAMERLQQSSVALANYRNKKGVIDPDRQAAAGIQLMTKLQTDLVAARAQLAEITAIAPHNSQIEEINYRIKALETALDEERLRVAGGGDSMASQGVEYQRVLLANTLAEKQYAVALSALQDARNAADKKQSYIEMLYQPNLPDKAEEPRRVRGVLSTLLFSLIVWGLARVILAGIREHQD